MQPSDSHVPSTAASVRPCQRPTSVWRLILCGTTSVASAGRARLHGRAARRREVTGSPWHRFEPRKIVGLPGCWVVLLLRAVVVHPTECPLPSPVRGENGCNLQAQVDPRHSEHTTFRGCIPTAHVLACLRIADGIAAAVARLATGWAGSPFAGRGSHPLDDDSEFREAIACLLLSDQPCLVAHLVVVLYAKIAESDQESSARLYPPWFFTLCFLLGFNGGGT